MLTSKLKLKRIHCKNDDDDITGTFVALCKNIQNLHEGKKMSGIQYNFLKIINLMCNR